jgi:tripartite ATP-independent transporter DctM subunit
MDTILLFAMFFFLMAIGLPVAFSMAIPPILLLIFKLDISTTLLPTVLVGSLDKWSWIAIPLFVFLGNLLDTTGIMSRLISAALALVGHIRGALSHVTVLVHLMMAGMSGSMVGDAAAIGSFMIPSMKRDGYPPKYAAAITAAGAILGPLVPPSIAAIIIGTAGDISILKIWLGGVLPGLILALLLILLGFIICRKGNYPIKQRPPLKEAARRIGIAFPALITPFIFIGGMRLGFFTATEAAAVGICYALFLAWGIYGGTKIADVYKASFLAVNSTVGIFFIIAVAGLFSWVLTTLQSSQQLSELVVSFSSNPTIFLYIVSMVVLILGCIVEGAPLMLVLVPLLAPAAERLGIDLVHFAVIFEMCTLIGQLTPPVGITMFVVCQIGEVGVDEYSKSIFPFLMIFIGVVFLVIHFPSLATWLPNMVMGGGK